MKGYVALNILVFDEELEALEQRIRCEFLEFCAAPLLVLVLVVELEALERIRCEFSPKTLNWSSPRAGAGVKF